MFMKIYKAYKFKLYPNNDQKELINKTLGCTRFIYNHYLSKKKRLYEELKTKVSCYECIKDLTNLGKEYPWLKEVDSMSLRCALFDLEDAFNGLFKGKGYPNFKNKEKKNSYRTNYINDNIRIDLANKVIRLPKLKDVEIRGYRNLNNVNGRIINATISKEPTGKYYVSVLVEEERDIKEITPSKIVGLDLGIKDVVTTSDGEKYKNEKVIKKYERRIIRLQRQLSKKVKKSNNYIKLRKKIALLYSKISNARKHNVHTITNTIIKEYDIIVTETLKIKNMIKNHRLAKSIMDVTWYEIIRQLEYKTKWSNKNMYKIDSYYPSSKKCNVCGHINKRVSDLRIREFECEECGNYHDRDINASINIMIQGLEMHINKITKEYNN